LRNPNITGTLAGLFWFGLLFGLAWFLNRILDGRDFTPHRTRFEVMESNVSERVTSNAAYVVVTGLLTNGSDYSWKNVGVEAQLFDHKGHIIDVIQAPTDYGGLAVSRHSVAAFKIESRTGHNLKDYASHKVFVRWAKDARSWP
jgi:hypothetical protein